MSVILDKITSAVENRKRFASYGKGETQVSIDKVRDKLYVHLHNHLIFELDMKSGHWKGSDCGWPTVLTCGRLNACLEAVGCPMRLHLAKNDGYLFFREITSSGKRVDHAVHDFTDDMVYSHFMKK